MPGVADRAIAAGQEAFGGGCQFDLEGLFAVSDTAATRCDSETLIVTLPWRARVRPAVATYSGGPSGGDVTSGSTRSATDCSSTARSTCSRLRDPDPSDGTPMVAVQGYLRARATLGRHEIDRRAPISNVRDRRATRKVGQTPDGPSPVCRTVD